MSTASDDPLIGEDIAGYRIVAVIGEGGMGRVYAAELPLIGARVAIKVLSHGVADSEMAERFVAEARIANMVRHDGLVNVIGLGMVRDGRPYQMMELLHGASLADLIEHGPLPLGSAIEIVCEALRALAALHARGIVHRDLKPSNLFVTTAGHVKLIDFGIAKVLAGRGLTVTGQTLGTPAYMAPEQLAGESVDARADLYAMGVVLFEVATGHRPFDERSLDEAMRARPPATGLAPGLDAVIARSMDPDRHARFGDAAEMERALADVASGLPAEAFRPLEVASADRWDLAETQPAQPARSTLSKLGRYEVRGVVGQGGAGVVMEGFDPVVERKVALKVLHARKRSDRLVREAQAMAKIAHPNVVTLYELGDDGERVFIAMEYVAGTNLAVWLGAARPWREIVAAFVDAGRGLAAAHAGGIVHGDFKPANVLIDGDGRVRVGDFGLAAVGATPRDAPLAGTPAYRAPERLDGANDARSDQFAFCASLWEALHGQLPFSGDTAHALARSAYAGEIRAPANADVAPAVNAVLRRGLAGAPERRFPSMTELLAALDAAVARRPRRWPWLAGAAAIAAAGAIVAVAPWRSGEREPRDDELAAVRAATDPSGVFRELARLPPSILAGDDARRLAAAAAVAGPVRRITETSPVGALAFSDDTRRLAVASHGSVAIYPLAGGPAVRLAIPGDASQLRFAADRVVALVGDGIVEAPLDGRPTRYLAHCANANRPGWAFFASADLRFGLCGSMIVDTATNATHNIGSLGVQFSQTGGRLLATGQAVEVYDAQTGALIGSRDTATNAIVTLNDELVAIAAAATVVVWNPATHSERKFAVPFDVRLMTISDGPDPQLFLASESEGGLWSATGERRARVPLAGLPKAVDLLPDPAVNRVIVTYPDSFAIEDLAANREIRIDATATVAATSRDASVLAMARGTAVSVWYPDLRAPRSIAIDTTGVLAANVSDDGRWLAYPAHDQLAVEDLLVGKPYLLIAVYGIQRTVFSHDAQRVALVDGNNRAWTWQFAAAYPVPHEVGVLPDAVQKLAIIDADRVVAMGHDTRVRLVANGNVSMPCGDGAGLVMVGSVAVVEEHGEVVACDVLRGTKHALYRTRDPHVTMTVDESRLLAVEGYRLRVFRTADGVEEPLPSPGSVLSAHSDRSGARIAANIKDRGIVVIDRATGGEIALAGSRGAFGERMAPDGSHVLAVVDGHLRMWNLAEPRRAIELGTLGGLPMARLAIGPDIALTLSSGIDRHIGPRAVGDVWPVALPSTSTVSEWIRRLAP